MPNISLSKDDNNTPFISLLALVSESYDFDGGMICSVPKNVICFFLLLLPALANLWYNLVHLISMSSFLLYLPIRLITKVQHYKQINNKI